MGRFVYSMNVSLDLLIEQVPGDDGAGEWLRIDEELHRAFNAHTQALALLVQGRVIHEIMEEYWPRAREDTVAARLPARVRRDLDRAAQGAGLPHAAHAPTTTPRIIGGDDAIAQLADLRARTDGAIGVGGANLATQLLRAGLLDELLLATHPAILGFGRPLFDDYDHADRPRPARAAIVRSPGVTMRRYAVRGAQEEVAC